MIAAIKAKVAAYLNLLKGWRTVLFGAAVSALGTWDALSASGFDITPFIPAEKRGQALIVIGVIVSILRFFTTTGIGSK